MMAVRRNYFKTINGSSKDDMSPVFCVGVGNMSSYVQFVSGIFFTPLSTVIDLDGYIASRLPRPSVITSEQNL